MIKTTKTIVKEIYVAWDGTEFFDEVNCLCHEQELEQARLEEKAEAELGIVTKADYPAMLNPRIKHQYKLFLIKNEQDLDRFINIYEYWFTNLESYWEVNKETFVYPDVLCILDFPRGDETPRLYKLSRLCNQFNAFIEDVTLAIDKKLDQEL